MLKSTQFTRSALIAVTVISLAASPAVAREADAPVHPGQTLTTVTPHARQWTQPRVDSMGVRPANQPAAASPAIALTEPADQSGGVEWLLIAIVASTTLALLLITAVSRVVRHRAQSFRARQL